MPELPEVETVKRTLEKTIIGKTIISVDVRYDKILKNQTKEDFISKLSNQTFRKIQRKGKHLICILDDYYLLVHLRMEGKFFVMHDEEYSKHDHIIFKFNDSNIRYNDTRKFGTMYLYNINENIDSLVPLCNVAKDPLDTSFDYEYFIKQIQNKKQSIKQVLLDQSVVSGLGNIYVDEVLFMSKIIPTKKTPLLTNTEICDIVKNSKIVLNKAISLGGTTIKSFTSSHLISGRFQNELLIHTKEVCPICKTKVLKIKVGGRGTYFCPVCQKSDIDK